MTPSTEELLEMKLKELEERVSRLENLPDGNEWRIQHLLKHHSGYKPALRKAVGFCVDNAETLVAIGVLLLVNILVWEKL